MSSGESREYKDSDVGCIPGDWSVAALGDLGRCVRGVSYKPDHLRTEPSAETTTLLRSNNIRDGRINFESIQHVAGCKISDAQYLKLGDVAICMSNGSKALVGKAAVLKSEQLARHPRLTVGAFCSIYRSQSPYTAQVFNSDFYQGTIELLLAGSAINNLKGSDIESIRFPLPSIGEQRKIAAIFTSLNDKLEVVARQVSATQTLWRGLMQTLFSRGIGVKDADGRWSRHTQFRSVDTNTCPSAWRFHRMGDIAPVVRREVDVQTNDSYPELGIRSFGKGTFHKPALSGDEVGSKRLFVIKAGDLLLSNVFAWEGAIAIAGQADDGRYGSHRYITCKVNPDIANAHFIARYLVTPEGLASIGLASPGGAGRNKTLGLAALADIRVPSPPLAEQNAIIEILSCVEAKIAVLQEKQERYREIKRGLMQKLMTGKWRVKVDAQMAV